MTNSKSPIPDPHYPNALLVVAKRPAPGRTKTRLVPPLSAEQAAALYECFLHDTLDLMRQIPDVQPVVAYCPPRPGPTLLAWHPTLSASCSAVQI